MAATQRKARRVIEPGRTASHPPVAISGDDSDAVQARQAQIHDGGALPLAAVAAIAKNASAGLVKPLTKSGGSWRDLLADIRAQREGGEADAARTALGALFAATPNGNLETMKLLFEARFGVQVSTGSDKAAKKRLKDQAVKEKEFDAPGLRRIYEAFKVLPPSQAEAGLLTMMTRHREGAEDTSGFAFNADPHLSLEYKKGSTEAAESGDYTHEGDVMRGMNMLDTTAVHELGHKVDTGEKYSGKASFKKLAGWKVHARGQALVRDLQAALSEPLGDVSGLSRDDKALLVRGAEHASMNRRKNVADAYQDLMEAYADLGKHEEPEKGDSHQDIIDLWEHAGRTQLFRHVIAGHEDSGVWWREPFGYLTSRQYHEAYSWESGWWSYENTAGEKKLSIYRVGLRFPGWTFASVSCEPEHRAMDHGLPDRPMVVQDDGTVCQGKAEDEVAQFLASLGLPETEPAKPLHKVARAVLFFAGDPASVLEAEDVANWMRNRKGADLAEPSLAIQRGGATLAFWAQVSASGRHPPTFKRFEVRLDAKGRVKIKQKTFKTTSR